MDPYEQRLRDEVIYLHSLWHQGPPPSNPNINARLPKINSNYIPSTHLQPSNPTQFKRQRQTPSGRRGRKSKNCPLPPHPPPLSDNPWPCPPPAQTPQETSSGWPSMKPNPSPSTRLASAEEQARLAAGHVQKNALKAAQEFFASSADSDDDEDCEDEDDLMEENGSEEYKFFLKVFMEDNELRGYYEKNYGSGEFCCLVCGGVGKNAGKRFKDCVALVQHSIAIAKTKKKWAHRAYGQAICKVLGWDIDRLSTIVSSLSDPLGGTLNKSCHLQGSSDVGGKEDPNVVRNNDEAVSMKVFKATEDLPNKTAAFANAMGGEVRVCENSSKVADANRSTEVLHEGVSNVVGGDAEGVVNCLEPLKKDGVGSEVKNDQSDTIVLDGLNKGNENQN